MIKRINKHLEKNDKLLKHSLIVFIATIVTGFLNYVYQIYMGRALGPEEYGLLGALFSIVYMEMFSLGSINTVISKLIAEYKAEGKTSEIKSLFYFISTRLFFVGLSASILVVLFRDFFMGYLNLPDSSMVYLLSFIVFVTFLGPIVSGMLNGLQLFVWSGVTGFFGSLFKLLIGVLLVYYGLGVNGALIGLLVGSLIPLAMLFYPIRDVIKYKAAKINHSEIFRYAGPAMLVVMIATMIVNFDMILVRHKFNSFDSGIYSAASTLAKIIWFASASLVTVMLPKIRPGNSVSLLRHTLLYVFLIGFGISSVYFFAPEFVVGTLFGSSYDSAIPFIGLFGISIALFSMSNVLITYNLVTRRLGMAYIAIIALMAEFVLISYFASSILEVVKVVLAVNLALFLAMMVYTKNYLVVKHEA